ncbi:MAG: MiaB/RimO family radical SAM methylthiotransferase [Desulfamplus sp.]|nr:MiaB/RimO family radical SAM methylthiotransferase [Desulfamplus sp.]
MNKPPLLAWKNSGEICQRLMKTFYITTLGCKVNQYESDGIAAELVSGGWQREDNSELAQICIINTCAVTSRAAMQSRQQIRSIIRSNPDAKIIVTGCHAQTAPDEILKIDKVDIITGHRDKFKIAKAILESESSVLSGSISMPSIAIPLLPPIRSLTDSKSYSGNKPYSDSTLYSNDTFQTFSPAVTGNKTRAYLKIQDGCNAFCTYCIVPHARGRSRSMPMNEVIEHLEHLSAKGYKEAILTGIHVGAYGLDLENGGFNLDKDRLDLKKSDLHFNKDRSGIEQNCLDLHTKVSLTDLLMKIERLRPIHRIRLSSIEPRELTDQIISLALRSDLKTLQSDFKKISADKTGNIANQTSISCNKLHNHQTPTPALLNYSHKTPILCDHFHIPLQSGDDTILKQMGRPYDSALFEELVTKIHNTIKTAAIGVDILVGFPGESDLAFENTLNLIAKLPVSYLHVFPFSPRKGTPAFDYPDWVDTKTVKKRCAILRKLGTMKKKEFENSQMGSCLESVIQETTDGQTGQLIAITSNYLSVVIEERDGSSLNKNELKRQIVNIELTGRDKNNRLTGKIA